MIYALVLTLKCETQNNLLKWYVKLFSSLKDNINSREQAGLFRGGFYEHKIDWYTIKPGLGKLLDHVYNYPCEIVTYSTQSGGNKEVTSVVNYK